MAQAIRDHSPTAVYVISDGYDNTPAGRFGETVQALRKIGVEIPIYHLNPVPAAETASVRQLAPGLVPTMPVQNPNAFGAALLREALEQDPLAGVRALLKQGRQAMLDAVTGRKALAAAKADKRKSNGKAVSKEAKQAAKSLSSPMASALRAIYTASPDSNGRVRITGLARQDTAMALSRRKLIKDVSAGFVRHTPMGRQVVRALAE